MSADLDAKRSRRAILGAGLGAVAAGAAAVVAVPAAVLAGSDVGKPINVGSQYFDVQDLTILSSASAADVLNVATTGTGTALSVSSGTGYGVYGQSESLGGHAGVYGYSTNGIAIGSYSPSGVSLQAIGRVQMPQNSGVATLAAGTTSVVVNPSLEITPSSFVLLTPKTNVSGRSIWYTTNTAANTFTIHMSSSRSGQTRIAWLLLG